METENTPLVPASYLNKSIVPNVRYVVVLLFMVTFGFSLEMVFDKYLPTSLSNTKKSYNEGFNSARNIAENSIVGSLFKKQENKNSLVGTIVSVSGNKITMHVVNDNPFENIGLQERVIMVTKDTRIIRFKLSEETATSSIDKIITSSSSTLAMVQAGQINHNEKQTSEVIPVTDLVNGTKVSILLSNTISSSEISAKEIYVQNIYNPQRK